MVAKTYRGEGIEIHYEVRRCIHAAECVDRLQSVFDKNQRPWINPNGATAEATAEIIDLCPSGALTYTRGDGIAESLPPQNRIKVQTNGPLYLHGDLHLHMPDGEVRQMTRVALCRCGKSENKPFCDNRHKEGFEASARLGDNSMLNASTEETALHITPKPNESIKITGPMVIQGAGQTTYEGTQVWLCRCGGSRNKPFCDGSHKDVGFQSE